MRRSSGKGVSGTSQLVVDADRDVVVGATFTGPDVQELLHRATIAVVAQVPLTRLWHAVPSFPTVSEVWLRLLEAYGLLALGGAGGGQPSSSATQRRATRPCAAWNARTVGVRRPVASARPR